MRVWSSLAAIALMAWPNFGASEDGLLAESRASNLLQSRTQVRILGHDDKEDLACKERRFVSAQVVGPEPAQIEYAIDGDGDNMVRERRWQEEWTLDRCGRTVGYRVFFTDLGDGGAYFAFTRTR